VLITGADSFIAKELVIYFSHNDKIKLILAPRTVLDVTDAKQVAGFFESNKIDVVIHTAVKGGKRNQTQYADDGLRNISMFNNLFNCSHKFSMMFNIASGAEFDRAKNIESVNENEIYQHYPKDYYGLSKNLISRKIASSSSKIFNLRLFGCFGEHEEGQRFIKSSFKKIQNNESITIHQDKYMDYFYAQDVGKVIEHIIGQEGKNIPRDINLCYPQKHKLTEIANKIIYLTRHKKPVIIEKSYLANAYTGNGDRLSQMNIKLIGLNKGIEQCLDKWSKL